jgi:hypothetical protein
MEIHETHMLPLYTRVQETNGIGTRFMARPLRHWRKQYQSHLAGQRNAAVGMPMDRPGSSIPSSLQCTTCHGAGILAVDILHDSPCTSCQPIINDTRFSEKAYHDTAAYLQSRCSTYEQKASTIRNPAATYFTREGIPTNPSDSPLGAQVRESVNCVIDSKIKDKKCNNSIYKPNNVQYAQQGGVSSGSRIARLRYNTLNNNGAAFNSAAGAVNINSGRYQTEPSPSYYNKYKPQVLVDPRKSGAKSYCLADYSACTLE